MSATDTDDPFQRFDQWYREAEAAEPDYPDGACLATADAQGRPSARMVLVKGVDGAGVDRRGFVFYTNLESRKGRQLAENPFAALSFYWKSVKRQVRIEGPVEPVADDEADAYFATRPRLSQIGAWASRQSQPLDGRLVLERRVAEYTARFNIGQVPRPPFWSGFRLLPERIEFWSEGAFRLHDRLVFLRDGDGWRTERLFP